MKFLFILLLFLVLPVFAVGPIGEYYVVNWCNGGMHVLQNNTVVRSWGTGGSSELAVVVEGNSVKTFGYQNGNYGRQYSLSGTVLGPTYTNTFSGVGFHDGATDGTYFYGWSWHNQTLYRFDKNWSNATSLFSLSGQNRLAITYDPTNASIWLSGYNDSSYTMQNYTLSGSFIKSFNVADYNTGGLAMDYNDGTLWYSVNGGETFRQYSRSGTLLQTVTISGAGANMWGGEFMFNSTVIPEPSTVALLLLSVAALHFLVVLKKA